MKRATNTARPVRIFGGISIHALMKRATYGLSFSTVRRRFQSTPSWRGRPRWQMRRLFWKWFQSTPSWRGRLTFAQSSSVASTFQSTPSWRGRRVSSICISLISEFQSTPSWRGRLHRWLIRYSKRYFNPRPHEEGDRFSIQAVVILSNFNPRPHEEGDIVLSEVHSDVGYFNPRPHEEGDLCFMLLPTSYLLFQSTPSWRGRHRKERL